MSSEGDAQSDVDVDFALLGLVAAPPHAPAAAPLPEAPPAAAAPETLPEAPPAAATRAPPAKTQQWAKLGVSGRSSERSATDHKLVCERMRAKKKQRREQRADMEAAALAGAVVQAVGRRVPRLERLLSRKRKKPASAAEMTMELSNLSRRTVRGALGPRTDLSIAFDKTLRSQDCGRTHGVHRSTVVATRAYVAAAVNDMMDGNLKKWREVCEAEKPCAVVMVRKWDEATSRLQMLVDAKGLGNLTGGQSTMPVCVLQSRRTLLLVWPSRTVSVEIPSKPVPVASTQAENIGAAMDDAAQIAGVSGDIEAIMKTASVRIELNGQDGHYGNARYSAHRAATRPDLPQEVLLCGNHQNGRTEAQLDDLIGKAPRNALYAFATYMRTSNNFLRMIWAMKGVLEQQVVIIPGDPPPGASSFSTFLFNHMMLHHKAFEKAYKQENRDATNRQSTEDHTSSATLRAAWEKFLHLFNGDFAKHLRDGKESPQIPHYAGGRAVDRVDLVGRMTRSAVEVSNSVLFAPLLLLD